MAGRVALITGSTSGIGIAKSLAIKGYSIFLNGFGDMEIVETLRKDLKQQSGGSRVEHISADLSKPVEIELMFKILHETCPNGIDILVNNAGIQHVAPIETFPKKEWDRVIAINLSASFHTIQLALPKMRSKGWGRIVNVSSAHGLVASPYKTAYVASKHGMLGLTKSVALETANSGITCNALCPGWVLTPLVEKQVQAIAQTTGISFSEAKTQLVSEKQPQTEMVTPEQVGDLVGFLCSDSARTITGATISIDGGWTTR